MAQLAAVKDVHGLLKTLHIGLAALTETGLDPRFDLVRRDRDAAVADGGQQQLAEMVKGKLERGEVQEGKVHMRKPQE